MTKKPPSYPPKHYHKQVPTGWKNQKQWKNWKAVEQIFYKLKKEEKSSAQ
jgi:hypothetical protein